MSGGRSAPVVGLKPGWRDLRFVLLESHRSHAAVLPPLRLPPFKGRVEGFDISSNQIAMFGWFAEDQRNWVPHVQHKIWIKSYICLSQKNSDFL